MNTSKYIPREIGERMLVAVESLAATLHVPPGEVATVVAEGFEALAAYGLPLRALLESVRGVVVPGKDEDAYS